MPVIVTINLSCTCFLLDTCIQSSWQLCKVPSKFSYIGLYGLMLHTKQLILADKSMTVHNHGIFLKQHHSTFWLYLTFKTGFKMFQILNIKSVSRNGMHTYIKGAFRSTKSSGNFGLKLNGSSQTEKFWKSIYLTVWDTKLAIQTTMHQGAADNITHLDAKTQYGRSAWNKIFNFSRLDQFDQNWPFHSTFSTHCRYQYLTVGYFPSGLLIHPCVVTTVT